MHSDHVHVLLLKAVLLQLAVVLDALQALPLALLHKACISTNLQTESRSHRHHVPLPPQDLPQQLSPFPCLWTPRVHGTLIVPALLAQQHGSQTRPGQLPYLSRALCLSHSQHLAHVLVRDPVHEQAGPSAETSRHPRSSQMSSRTVECSPFPSPFPSRPASPSQPS